MPAATTGHGANAKELVRTERCPEVTGAEADDAETRGEREAKYAGRVVGSLIVAEADNGQGTTTVARETSRTCHLLEEGVLVMISPVI